MMQEARITNLWEFTQVEYTAPPSNMQQSGSSTRCGSLIRRIATMMAIDGTTMRSGKMKQMENLTQTARIYIYRSHMGILLIVQGRLRSILSR